MSSSRLKNTLQLPRYLVLALFIVSFSGGAMAANEDSKSPSLSDLTVQKQIEESDGSFSDLFVELKKHPHFLHLSQKHALDDPAGWPELRRRFVLKLAELQGQFSEAKSMMAARDSRSGLNDKVNSAEKTREKGRSLHDQLLRQMYEYRQMLRLIEEFETAFEALSADGALTDEISIENKAGQGFPGKVLFVDGNDLIVKRQGDEYFRVPSNLLSEKTKLMIINGAFSGWQELPGLELELDEKDVGELIAYSDSHLYINDSTKGVFSEPRSDDETVFVSLAALLESAREALASGTKEKNAIQAEVDELQQALLLNQSRLETIQWYESRLGIEIPESVPTGASTPDE